MYNPINPINLFFSFNFIINTNACMFALQIEIVWMFCIVFRNEIGVTCLFYRGILRDEAAGEILEGGFH